jgi:isopenicillin N synthase-like dioxygenase
VFDLPDDVKRSHQVKGGAGQRGYTPFGVETAKGGQTPDLKEFWHVGRDLAPGHRYSGVMPANVWPEAIASFKPTATALYAAFEIVGAAVLRAIGQRLGVAEGYFPDAVQDGNSVLRLLRYPPLQAGASGIRAEAHEDINAITLLLGAEEAGLEIRDPDGGWLQVQPPQGALVCNIGDMLQRLTNDVLPSTTHRVVNPTQERAGTARYSAPFFLHFRPDVEIRTLASCISAERPDRYPQPITAQAFLEQRLREIKLTAG